VEAARVLGRYELFELAVTGPAVEAAGDQDRLALRPHTQPLELVDRRRERVLARIVWRAGERQLRRLDDERHAGARLRQRFERRARERKAKRIADGRADVCDRFACRAVGAARWLRPVR
jgi:hypothetical protein